MLVIEFVIILYRLTLIIFYFVILVFILALSLTIIVSSRVTLSIFIQFMNYHFIMHFDLINRLNFGD